MSTATAAEPPRVWQGASVRAVAGLSAGGVALWWLIPHTTGVSWSAIVPVLRQVGAGRLGLLTVLWAAGLVAHSFVLTGALPGLSRTRALTLNLTGSAVSNVAPLGGAVGVATNLTMTTAWGFSRASFAAFTLVTNLWDVLAKLALPTVTLVVLVASGVVPSGPLRTAAGVATAMLIAVTLAWISLLVHPGTARWMATTARTLATLWLSPAGAARVHHLVASARTAREQSRQVVAERWPQLTAGMLSYVGLQGALLWACLAATGAAAPLTAVLAGLAVERLLSMAVITPGGTGITEAATVATIVALGGSPVGVVVAVLLHRCFTFVLEIPVGGLWLVSWLVLRPRAGHVTP